MLSCLLTTADEVLATLKDDNMRGRAGTCCRKFGTILTTACQVLATADEVTGTLKKDNVRVHASQLLWHSSCRLRGGTSVPPWVTGLSQVHPGCGCAQLQQACGGCRPDCSKLAFAPTSGSGRCAAAGSHQPPCASQGTCTILGLLPAPDCPGQQQGLSWVSAAHGWLAAQDPERQKEVSELLGSIESEEFSHLVTLGKMMVDFSSTADAGAASACVSFFFFVLVVLLES